MKQQRRQGPGAAIGLALCLSAGGASAETEAPSLDELLQRFEGEARQVAAEVRIDGRLETKDAGMGEIVITLLPEGETKLIADPGITVTPASRAGIEWRVDLPLRHADHGTTYFTPPATVRLPFHAKDDAASGEAPVDILVEYAYCVVDYQCFFGEETLSVATRIP